MTSRPTRFETLVELSIVLLALHLFLLLLFREYGLDGLRFRETLPSTAAILGLLVLRSKLGKGRGAKGDWKERRAPGRWLDGFGAPGMILATAFLIALHLFHHYGGRLGNDGVLQFIYVRSLVMDFDLDFTNEFQDFVPEKFQFIAEQARSLGRTPDPLSEPGPSLLWAPFFLAAHVVVLLARAMGSAIPANGYSYPYVNAVCLGSLVWAFVAVVLSYRISARYFPAPSCAVSVSVLWFGTTLLWYSVYNPSMPHAVTAAAVAVFVSVWLGFRETPSLSMWLALGLSSGLLLSMQRYDVYFLAAPLLTITGHVRAAVRDSGFAAARRYVGLAAVAGAGFLLMAAPLFTYNLFYSREGTLFRWGESLEAHYLRHWKDPRVGEFLFSSNHGLFSWTPLVYLAVAGLVIFLWKDRRVGGALLITLAAGVYLLSSTWDWYSGASFGSRRMTEAFVVFAVGFCAIAHAALARPRLVALTVAAPLVLWNFLLADLTRRGDVPDMGTFSFAEAGARAVERLHNGIGYPGSAPANWLFARRYGVSPGRFDPVYGHREYHNLDVDVGAPEDARFLGKGWSVPERRPDGGTYRWSVGAESSWLVNLFSPFDYRLTLRGGPSRHPQGQPQTVFVEVNGAPVTSVKWPAGGPPSVEVLLPSRFWRDGLNEIAFEYGWEIEAGEVYGGNDSRAIAIWLDRLSLRIER